jgi:hypothetical protein
MMSNKGETGITSEFNLGSKTIPDIYMEFDDEDDLKHTTANGWKIKIDKMEKITEQSFT